MRVLDDLGHSTDPLPDLKWVVGPPLADLLTHIMALFDDDRVSKAMGLYRAHYAERGRFKAPLYNGMSDVIRTLSRSPARLFTATSKPMKLAEQILEMHGLSRCFERIYGAKEDDTAGEKPQLIAKIVKENALTGGKSVMVGDRVFDITGAKANHLLSVGVLWGYGTLEELSSAQADRLVRSPEALLPSLKSLLADTSPKSCPAIRKSLSA